jgi:hypothetical protein
MARKSKTARERRKRHLQSVGEKKDAKWLREVRRSLAQRTSSNEGAGLVHAYRAYPGFLLITLASVLLFAGFVSIQWQITGSIEPEEGSWLTAARMGSGYIAIIGIYFGLFYLWPISAISDEAEFSLVSKNAFVLLVGIVIGLGGILINVITAYFNLDIDDNIIEWWKYMTLCLTIGPFVIIQLATMTQTR